MEQYISKSAILAKIKKLMYDANTQADIASTGEFFNEDIANAKYQLCKYILDFIETLTVKEVDIEKRRGMTYNELAEVFKRDGGDAQVCFSIINQNQILFGNNDTKKDISLKHEEPISE